MRRTWVYIDGVAYEKGTEPSSQAPMIMPDIKPYKSMKTGEMITSRSQHREHLKQHGLTELGNEPLKWLDKPYEGIPDANPQRRRELIAAQVREMTHQQFKDAIKRDVDRVKWNSNT